MTRIRTKQRRVILLYLLATALVWLLSAQSLAWGRGTLYVIGTGPAGPKSATVHALETIEKMDAFVAHAGHVKLFAKHIGDKPVIFDPWKGFWDYKGKPYNKLNKEDFAKFQVERFKIVDRNAERIKQLLAQGKDVGLLDSGNPGIFGPSHLYVERLDKADVVIIPGMGSDAAAMAALKSSALPAHGARFILQSAPFFLTGQFDSPDMTFSVDKQVEQQIFKDLAKYEHTMVLYMALREPVKLFNTLGKYLPKDTPAACVFWAGYPDKQRVVRGTVADMGAKLAKEKDRMMGLVFVGRFLEGQPFEGAKRLSTKQ